MHGLQNALHKRGQNVDPSKNMHFATAHNMLLDKIEMHTVRCTTITPMSHLHFFKNVWIGSAALKAMNEGLYYLLSYESSIEAVLGQARSLLPGHGVHGGGPGPVSGGHRGSGRRRFQNVVRVAALLALGVGRRARIALQVSLRSAKKTRAQ